ncbi:MAG: hypothetical protein JNJ49_04810 [Bdellovibrionaceae bacterium]|nr:hypothetical protein [Pseudobdellovibrionaceae bacterium]
MNRFRQGLIALICLFSNAWTPPADAGERPYRTGPIAAGLGGAGRAAVDATESAWLNPAGLVHIQRYHAAFSTQQSSQESGDSFRDYAVMLADGEPERTTAGAFSYVNRRTLRGGAGEIVGSQQDIQLSFASFVPFPRRLSVGATFRHLIHQEYGGDISQNNFTLGLLMPMGRKWGFAVVGSDLAGASDAVSPEARMIPTLAVGVHVVPHQLLRIRADWVKAFEQEAPIGRPGGPSSDSGRSDLRMGLESWFREDFAFRVGGAWLESRDQMWVTTGLGFRGPKLSFGYAFERDVRSGEATRHTFDLWMPL